MPELGSQQALRDLLLTSVMRSSINVMERNVLMAETWCIPILILKMLVVPPPSQVVFTLVLAPHMACNK